MERFNRIDKIIVEMTADEFKKLSDAYWDAVLDENETPFKEITKLYGITADDVAYWMFYDD